MDQAGRRAVAVDWLDCLGALLLVLSHAWVGLLGYMLGHKHGRRPPNGDGNGREREDEPARATRAAL